MNDANAYIAPLLRLLAENANSAESAAMSKYMRHQFDFFGIKSPQRKALTRQFLNEQGLPAIDLAPAVARALWQQPQRECQYAALSILYRLRHKFPPEIVELYEELIVTKSWWDTVDELAGKHVGEQVLRHPAIKQRYIANWWQADNMWLRRTAILFQRHFKLKTNPMLLFAIIRENLGSDEFFINKAIGWALREYSKTDPKAVADFVRATPELSPLSQREALKWMKSKGYDRVY